MITETQIAVGEAKNFFRDALPATDIRLEEIELSEDERFWNITLSGLLPREKDDRPELSAIAEIFRKPHERVYKVFVVEDGSCKVRSMKIRSLALETQ